MSTPASAPTYSQAVGLIGLGLMGRNGGRSSHGRVPVHRAWWQLFIRRDRGGLIPGSSVSRANPCRYPYV